MSKRRKQNHTKRPTERQPLTSGQGHVTFVEHKGGVHGKVALTYHTHSRTDQGDEALQKIQAAMMRAAQVADLGILAEQRADEVIKSEEGMLTPDGIHVLHAWIPESDGSIVMVSGRNAVLEDHTKLAAFGENEGMTLARQERASQVLAEKLEAAAQVDEAIVTSQEEHFVLTGDAVE